MSEVLKQIRQEFQEARVSPFTWLVALNKCENGVAAVLEPFINKLEKLNEKRPLFTLKELSEWFEEFEGVLKMETKQK